jgi:hypothetical protein
MRYTIEHTDGTTTEIDTPKPPRCEDGVWYIGSAMFPRENVKLIVPTDDYEKAAMDRYIERYARLEDVLRQEIEERWDQMFPDDASLMRLCKYRGVLAGAETMLGRFLLNQEPEPSLSLANKLYLEAQEKAARILRDRGIVVENPVTGKPFFEEEGE